MSELRRNGLTCATFVAIIATLPAWLGAQQSTMAAAVQPQQEVPNLLKLTDTLQSLGRTGGPGAEYPYLKNQFEVLERTLRRRVETIALDRRRVSATQSAGSNFSAGSDLARL